MQGGAVMFEHKKLVEELSEGMEKAKQLRRHMCAMYTTESEECLLQRITSSFEKALMILNRCGSKAPVDSSVPVYQSVRRYNTVRDASKRRKLQQTWTERIRVESANRFEGPGEDGYSWRKYGQKDILGAKYPRSYYRCTYRHVRNCLATKQVQRSDSDRTVFEVTYKGTHSCNEIVPNSGHVTEPNTQIRSSNNSQYHHQTVQQNDILQNMKANLKVDTHFLNMEEPTPALFTEFVCNQGDNHYSPLPALIDDRGSYTSTPVLVDESGMSSYSSPLFPSPITSMANANYYNEAFYQMRSYGKIPLHSETHVPDAASAHASTTNSSNEGIRFSNDEVALDSSFLINITEFC